MLSFNPRKVFDAARQNAPQRDREWDSMALERVGQFFEKVNDIAEGAITFSVVSKELIPSRMGRGAVELGVNIPEREASRYTLDLFFDSEGVDVPDVLVNSSGRLWPTRRIESTFLEGFVKNIVQDIARDQRIKDLEGPSH